MRIYIPSGEIGLRRPGWLLADNCSDKALALKPDIVCDMRDLPFKKNELEEIYCCHGIEHLLKKEVLPCLKQFREKLRPGGRLRLAVPDFERIVQFWNESRAEEAVMFHLFGRQENEGQIHFMCYTSAGLSTLMRKTGFKRVGRWEPLKESFQPRDNALHWVPSRNGSGKIFTSLNIEGWK